MTPEFLEKFVEELARYGFITSEGRLAIPSCPKFLLGLIQELDRYELGCGTSTSPANVLQLNGQNLQLNGQDLTLGA